jgi:hypothetical protein
VRTPSLEDRKWRSRGVEAVTGGYECNLKRRDLVPIKVPVRKHDVDRP